MKVEIYQTTGRVRGDTTDVFIVYNVEGKEWEPEPELATCQTQEMAEALCKGMGWDYKLNVKPAEDTEAESI